VDSNTASRFKRTVKSSRQKSSEECVANKLIKIVFLGAAYIALGIAAADTLDGAQTKWTAGDLTLSILKVAGIIVAGLSGVLGTLLETKTDDKKHLSSSGWTLLVLGIGATLIALAIEIREYAKDKKADEEKKQETVELLRQIQRSVTRFQDVTMDLWLDLPLQNGLFDAYLHEASKRMANIPKNAESNNVVNGTNRYSATEKLLQLSDLQQSPELYDYLSSTIPYLYIFRNPIKGVIRRTELGNADLVMYPVSVLKNETIKLVLDDKQHVTKATFVSGGVKFQWSDRSTTGKIRSELDLESGAELIFFPEKNRNLSIWDETKITGIALFINGERWDLRLQQEKTADGHVVYRCIPVRDGRYLNC
jgi:hypothetical protein